MITSKSSAARGKSFNSSLSGPSVQISEPSEQSETVSEPSSERKSASLRITLENLIKTEIHNSLFLGWKKLENKPPKICT